jgi:hypothetical protein
MRSLVKIVDDKIPLKFRQIIIIIIMSRSHAAIGATLHY